MLVHYIVNPGLGCLRCRHHEAASAKLSGQPFIHTFHTSNPHSPFIYSGFPLSICNLFLLQFRMGLFFNVIKFSCLHYWPSQPIKLAANNHMHDHSPGSVCQVTQKLGLDSELVLISWSSVELCQLN